MDNFIENYYKRTPLHKENAELRKQYSVMAMQGLLSNRIYSDNPKNIAKKSVEYADALIKELNK